MAKWWQSVPLSLRKEVLDHGVTIRVVQNVRQAPIPIWDKLHRDTQSGILKHSTEQFADYGAGKGVNTHGAGDLHKFDPKSKKYCLWRETRGTNLDMP